MSGEVMSSVGATASDPRAAAGIATVEALLLPSGTGIFCVVMPASDEGGSGTGIGVATCALSAARCEGSMTAVPLGATAPLGGANTKGGVTAIAETVARLSGERTEAGGGGGGMAAKEASIRVGAAAKAPSRADKAPS